jgi:hypothetical protein
MLHPEEMMDNKSSDRRDFLKRAGMMGSMAMMAGLPHTAMAQSDVREETLAPQEQEPPAA